MHLSWSIWINKTVFLIISIKTAAMSTDITEAVCCVSGKYISEADVEKYVWRAALTVTDETVCHHPWGDSDDAAMSRWRLLTGPLLRPLPSHRQCHCPHCPLSVVKASYGSTRAVYSQAYFTEQAQSESCPNLGASSTDWWQFDN